MDETTIIPANIDDYASAEQEGVNLVSTNYTTQFRELDIGQLPMFSVCNLVLCLSHKWPQIGQKILSKSRLHYHSKGLLSEFWNGICSNEGILQYLSSQFQGP